MNLVLGVSGSVAAYRAADLARELMRQGFTVRVCLTDAAQQFVTAALFEALTGQPCLQDVFEEPERGRMAHIDWARQADVLVIAPASANTLGKLAHGIGDDMLTTLAIAFDGPVVVAPAMNPTMFAHDSVQQALNQLEQRGVAIVEPESGDVACGENGQGKFPSIERIVETVMSTARRGQQLQGKRILITSGPTREPIDSVRFLSNRSSGKMGAALSQAALWMGAAEVHVVSGPVSIRYPQRATVHSVQTAQEMLEVSLALAKSMDFIIGAAAVADYRPAEVQTGKIRRSPEPIRLELVPNPDIIAALAEQSEARVIGFAAEPSEDLAHAEDKLQRKGLFAIAHNNVSQPGIGFDSSQNVITLIRKGTPPENFGPKSKLACALWLLSKVTQ